MSQPCAARPSAISRPSRFAAPVTSAVRGVPADAGGGGEGVFDDPESGMGTSAAGGRRTGRLCGWTGEFTGIRPYNREVRKIELPLPPPEARAASEQLCERIAARIAGAGGWIGFDAWMAMALYEPGLGYYSGGARKFGQAGDFVTAPEISPLFGACVAAQCAQWFERAPARIVEFGAGSGALAADVLVELARLGAAADEYLIVEVSGELRERQRETIARRAPSMMARVRWLDAWPARISGVILGNELLDAMPARVFRWHDGSVSERGVALETGPDGGQRFGWQDRPADADFERRVRARLAGPIADAGPQWPSEYVGELAEQAEAWMREAAGRLEVGAMLLIDYGFPRRELYHPQRASGTLMCHYRHHAHGDPFLLPGLQDLTVHVDFTAVAESATDAGLDLLGFTSQARFLFDLGLLDRLAQASTGAEAAGIDYRKQAQAVHTLISEAEMGELFKAIAFGRGMPPDALGFLRADRSGAL